MKRPGSRVFYQCVPLGIVLLSSPAALAHGCFECVIKTIVKFHKIRRKALGALWFWMEDEALTGCARKPNEKQPLPFLIAADRSHVSRLFAGQVNYGLAYLVFCDIRVFVTLVHRYRFCDFCDIQALVPEKFYIPDAVIRADRRSASG